MKRWVLVAIAAIAFIGFTALGVWQIERRAWKVALIERVEQRVHAAPVAAPDPSEWPALTAENAEYRRVKLTGRWLSSQQTLVRAVTELGEGFWLMEPLSTDAGFVVLVNRGWVPQGWHDESAIDDARGTAKAPSLERAAGTAAPAQPAVDNARTAAPTSFAVGGAEHSVEPALSTATNAATVTGLLRISEPHGAFLRSNDPANHRWYSRDVDAISHAQHLTGTAPYFIDAEAANDTGPQTRQPPVAGLTVIHFRNSHLQYVFTWFTLALMALWLGVRVARAR